MMNNIMLLSKNVHPCRMRAAARSSMRGFVSLNTNSEKEVVPKKLIVKAKPQYADLSDAEFLVLSGNKQGEALRATQIGAIANVFLAISKGSVGFAVGSTGLIADGANSLGDLLCDGVVAYTIVEARRAATPERPWGKGKLEPLGALTVGAVLLSTGLGIGYKSIDIAIQMINLHEVMPFLSNFPIFDGIGDGINSKIIESCENVDPNLMYAGIGVSLLSVGVKEVLYRYTLKAGTNADSPATMANAHQHRSDAIVSMAVAFGLVGKLLGMPILDPVAGVLVAGVIIKHGYATGVESIDDLSDIPADKDTTDALKRECLSVKGIRTVINLNARQSGPYLYVESTLGIDGTISASAGHRLAELAKRQMMKSFRGRVSNAVVHVDPLGSSGSDSLVSPLWARDHDNIRNEVEKILKNIYEPDGITGISEVQVYYQDDGSVSVKVDVRMCPDLTIKVAHTLAHKAQTEILSKLPGVGFVDVDLELDEDDPMTISSLEAKII